MILGAFVRESGQSSEFTALIHRLLRGTDTSSSNSCLSHNNGSNNTASGRKKSHMSLPWKIEKLAQSLWCENHSFFEDTVCEVRLDLHLPPLLLFEVGSELSDPARQPDTTN